LFALLHGTSKATADLPREWTRVLPVDAPLTTLERWERVFAQAGGDWPEDVDRSVLVLDILRILEEGPKAAEKAGERLLPRLSLTLWRRALKEGPPEALPVTLTGLRFDDGLEPASHVIWASAISLASAPRPYVRLLALNAGRWPRQISEDRLIPDHVIAMEALDPLPIAEADERDFATIIAGAKGATISFSRRDVEGRLLGRSPLLGNQRELYLSRGRVPEHAASESDRLLGRPSEFQKTSIARSGLGCWRDWYRPGITAHDGLVGNTHARLHRVLQQPQSATSLRLLLRDPIRFAWRYALGWRAPEEADEPLSLDALAFGNLVHEVLQVAVDGLEGSGGLALAQATRVSDAIEAAIQAIAQAWELEQPVPPAIIWRSALKSVKVVATTALSLRLESLSGQKSWTEVPFGVPDGRGRNDLPWDPARVVEVPGTGIRIQGYIDRLDLARDPLRARVIDYKTGRLNPKMSETVIKGGSELQRCLYAYAVKTLLGPAIKVEAAFLYPRAPVGEQALFPLPDVDAALEKLAIAIGLSRKNLESGLALPGIDAGDMFNDHAFALPSDSTYPARKLAPSREALGDAVTIWDAP